MRKQMTIKPKHNVGDFLRIKRHLPLPSPKIKLNKEDGKPANPEMDWLESSGTLYRVNEVYAQVCHTTTQIFYDCKRYRILAATDEAFSSRSRRVITGYEMILMDEGKTIRLREDEVVWVNPKKFLDKNYWGE